jgi:NitT/TauT family transport system substrate-binding protein
MKIALPDLISPSYFPAAAAVELGFFKEEGLDMELELIYPVDKTYAALRDGKIDFVAGSGHALLSAFPEWQGGKLLCAQGQGMYWFLVMHASLGAKRGDLSVLTGRSIGAAPWVDLGLKRLLVAAGIDADREGIKIGPVPGINFASTGVNFGMAAAKALEDRRVDGFWANGMGAETAVRNGWGTVVLDVRRGDGPKAAFSFTCPTIATSDRVIAEKPQAVAAAIRAIVKTQKALKADVSRATAVGKKLFPPEQAELIAELVRRDLPFYEATLSEKFVADMNEFARGAGVLKGHPTYENVVATQFRALWQG